MICGCISPSPAPQSTINIFLSFKIVKRSQYWKVGRPTINFNDYSLTMTRLTLLTKLIHLFYNRKTDQSNDNHERLEDREFMHNNINHFRPTTINMKDFFKNCVLIEMGS